MRQTSVINDLLSTITDNRLFGERRKPRRTSRRDLAQLIESLLNGRGESSSLERAAEFLRAYRDLDSAGRTFVFRTLAADYGPEPERLAEAAEAYLDKPSGVTAKALQRAAEPRRVEIFRRLNQVQGGTQALSRSLFASMVPKSQASEFFGFFSTSSKFAGILGPVIFALVSQLTGSSRLSIVAIVVFFVGGGLLLLLVDEEEGMRVAREEDEAFGAAGG